MSKPVVKATYTAPGHEPFTARRELPAAAPPPSSDAAASQEAAANDKNNNTAAATDSAFLVALRTAVASVQEEVNRELTARMVLDAQAAGGTAQGSATADTAAEKEEENYGEEMVEEE